MKLLFILCLNAICIISIAQKKYVALHLVYPLKMTYNTVLIKDNYSNILTEESKSIKNGWVNKVYKVDKDSIGQSFFSIYFGGSSLNVNDTLYFIGQGKNLLVKIKDSFALRNQINLKLKNVYNFEELYEKYSSYVRFYKQKFPNYSISKQQYLLKAGMNFVKSNASNPYAASLFSIYVIAPNSYADYDEAYRFYTSSLKNNIQDPQLKIFVENKIELLKQATASEGNKVPYFSERSIRNQIINTDSLLGRNILVQFWATWCSPCMTEIPYINQIAEKYRNDNLVIIDVSLDTDSTKMINVIDKKEMNQVHVFNNRSLIEKFRINPIPALFLIDEKGIIIYNKFNRENETIDLVILNSLLKQKFNH